MAYDDILPGGTTGYVIEVFARDTSSGQGKTGLAHGAITFNYQRQGAASLNTSTAVVEGTLGTWVSGGWKELGSGWYQFGIPNSVFAPGVGSVGLSFHASGMLDISRRILLTTSNLRVSTPAVAPGGNGGLATVDGSNRVAGIQGAKTTLDALQDLSASGAQSAASAALAAYDPPTRTEATSDKEAVLGAVGGLNDVSAADVQSAAAAALSAYDPPTYAELEARTLAGAGYATAAGQSSLSTALSALAAKFGGVTSIANWLRLLGRKDAADATAKSEFNSGGGTYQEATDSLQGSIDSGSAGGATPEQLWAYPSRTLTQSATQVASVVTGDAISVLRGDRLEITLTGVGSLVDRSKLWFTVKGDPARDADSAAVLQVEESAGLLRLNGAAYGTASDGAIEVTDAADGDLTLTLKAAAARWLPVRNGMAYDIQILVEGQPVTRVSGTFHVMADVTQAVS